MESFTTLLIDQTWQKEFYLFRKMFSLRNGLECGSTTTAQSSYLPMSTEARQQLETYRRRTSGERLFYLPQYLFHPGSFPPPERAFDAVRSWKLLGLALFYLR
jgi:hypothetical protein